MLIPYGPMSISGGRIGTTPGWQIWTKVQVNTKLFTTHCPPTNQQPHLFWLKNVIDHHKAMLALGELLGGMTSQRLQDLWTDTNSQHASIAFHADMSIHSSEMWPVLVPSSGKKNFLWDQTGLFLDELKYHFCLLLSPSIPLWVANFTN